MLFPLGLFLSWVHSHSGDRGGSCGLQRSPGFCPRLAVAAEGTAHSTRPPFLPGAASVVPLPLLAPAAQGQGRGRRLRLGRGQSGLGGRVQTTRSEGNRRGRCMRWSGPMFRTLSFLLKLCLSYSLGVKMFYFCKIKVIVDRRLTFCCCSV